MKKDLSILVVVILVGLIGAVYLKSVDFVKNDHRIPPVAIDPTPTAEEGEIVLALNQTGTIGSVRITPLAVTEDSRCAIDVICVWAGTVKIKVRIASGLGTSENIIELGRSITTEAEEVFFTEVSPSRKESEPTPESEYRFTFQVKKRPIGDINPGVPQGKCYVGGCSGEVCSDQDGIASNCIYKPEFACYKSATCERQSDGKCGWTKTPALTMCLENAQ